MTVGAVLWIVTRGDGSGEGTNAPTPGPTGTAPIDTGALGRGRDGDLRFAVNALQCGLENVVTAETTLPADGQFCLVDVDVTNTGQASVEWPLECQFLGLPEGQRLPPREEATLLDPGSQAAFGGPLEPGKRYAEVGLIFDIPVEASPSTVELHASCDSGGLVLQT